MGHFNRTLALLPLLSSLAITFMVSGFAVAEMRTADPIVAGDLIIRDAWIRQAPPGARVVGGYALITNSGTEPDRLIDGTADFARHIEVHEMRVADGIMKMRSLSEGLVIGPGETVNLKPGSAHLMFMDATSPRAGDTISVTLHFERAGAVDLKFAVAPIGSVEAPHH